MTTFEIYSKAPNFSVIQPDDMLPVLKILHFSKKIDNWKWLKVSKIEQIGSLSVEKKKPIIFAGSF